jgi:single-strand DNA-binding protein
MASFNKVVVMGNLTRNVELRHTPRGTAVCELGLAVNRSWLDKKSKRRKEEATFIDITMWGRQAEVAAEYLSKGSGVLIEGRLELEQWTDKTSRQRRSKLKVVGENMTMLPSNHAGQPVSEPPASSGDDSFGVGVEMSATF